ncbi:MAG: metal-dependent transcriptional regulator, partial [Thermoleophilaceae bacterium]|nr:metal-dependent transcriptional regulator [Thermoleophilaceae bacterium]
MSTDQMQLRSPAVEDYVKAIYSLSASSGEPASTNDLAARLDVSTGSVSAMLKRLGEDGLAQHEPYRGVELTPEGRNVALRVLRRHRLIELFLEQALDMPWEALHAEAEVLEHAASDSLVDLIADKLGDPLYDPHGDPIPTRDLKLGEQLPNVSLVTLEAGETAKFVRVSDANSDMLRYLSTHG